MTVCVEYQAVIAGSSIARIYLDSIYLVLYTEGMIGFNLLNEMNKTDDLHKLKELIAKAVEDLEDKQIPDMSSLATKKDISDLRADILDKMNQQTWRFLGGLAALGVIFKIADIVLHYARI